MARYRPPLHTKYENPHFGSRSTWDRSEEQLVEGPTLHPDWTTVQSRDDTDGMHRLTLSPRIRASAYYESTVAAGLTDISVYNKMAMPTSYGDLKAEYDRLHAREQAKKQRAAAKAAGR